MNQNHLHAQTIQRQMLDAGYDPEWSLFAESFAWFTMQKSLTRDEQNEFKETYEQVYADEVQTAKDRVGEAGWKAILDMNLTRPTGRNF